MSARDDRDRRIERRLNEIPSTGSKTGVFVGMEAGLAVVNINASTVRIPYVGQYPAQVGEQVQLERRNGSLAATGPANQRVSAGRVSAVTAPKLTILLADGTTDMFPYDNTAYPAPALNDEVAIDWFYPKGRVAGKLSTTPVVTPPAENTSPPPTAGHPPPFTALESGSYRPAPIASDDVIFGQSYSAAGWFYGSKVRDTIPDGASINVFRIYLNCRTGSGSELTLGLHAQPVKPGSAFSVDAQITVPGIEGGFSGWVDLLPLGGMPFAEWMRDNDGGIGTVGPGYRVLRGVSSDGLSGALDIGWS